MDQVWQVCLACFDRSCFCLSLLVCERAQVPTVPLPLLSSCCFCFDPTATLEVTCTRKSRLCFSPPMARRQARLLTSPRTAPFSSDELPLAFVLGLCMRTNKSAHTHTHTHIHTYTHTRILLAAFVVLCLAWHCLSPSALLLLPAFLPPFCFCCVAPRRGQAYG